jgi:hypothetical protein
MSQSRQYHRQPKVWNKLWVFGDSFAQHKCGKYEPDTDYSWVYQNHIIEGLGFEHSPEEYNFGKGGSSLDYTYTMVWEQWENIAPGDIVLIMATNYHRAWLFRDLPGISTLWNLDVNDRHKFKTLPKIARTYFNNYFKYSHVENNQHAKYQNFLFALSELQRQKQATVIVLPCFKYNKGIIPNNIIKGVRGTLSDISQSEWMNIKEDNSNVSIDRRMNHLTRQNHKVLAKKILYSIERGTDIDLEKGFYREHCDRNIWTAQ